MAVAPRLFFLGAPGLIGGAAVELYHTLRVLSREFRLTLIPTQPLEAEWVARLRRRGIEVAFAADDEYRDVPGLAGSVVVGMCDEKYLRSVYALRKLDCKLVWFGSMNWLSTVEIEVLKQHGPLDAYCFQSEYQQGVLQPRLESLGVPSARCRWMPAAFCLDDFPFAPRAHPRGTEFYVGRLSRPHADKFPVDLWETWGRLAYRQRRGRVMGWSVEAGKKCGNAPWWVDVLAPGAESSAAFLSSLHCLWPYGMDNENWPRIGLEALALGVPVVAPHAGGWTEMLGDCGLLAEDADEAAYCVAELAHNETKRRLQATAGREIVEMLTDVETCREAWWELVETL